MERSRRLIANLALNTLDTHILKNPDVVCYRRYVDDFVVVARSQGEPPDQEQLLKRFLPLQDFQEDVFKLDGHLLQRSGSELHLQRRKVRIHYLSGLPGMDFVNAVTEDFRRVVSERRAFLDTSVLLEDATAHLVSAGASKGSPLRVLRDADRSHLERFELSTSLQTLERVSCLVTPEQARDAVRRTLERISRVLDSEDNWVDNLDVALRLLKLAISTEDWPSCTVLIRRMDDMWGCVENLQSTVKGLFYRNRAINPSRSRPWLWLRNYLHVRRLEAVCSSLPPTVDVPGFKKWLPNGLVVEKRPWKAVALRNKANLLARSDLRARDREDDSIHTGALEFAGDADWMMGVLGQDAELVDRLSHVAKFVEICGKLHDGPWIVPPARLFLSTRPPSYFDIARRWLYKVELTGFEAAIFDELLAIVNAVRGTNYQEPVGRTLGKGAVAIAGWDGGVAEVSGKDRGPRLILGNLLVEDKHWLGAATRVAGSPFGKPDLDIERLIGIDKVLSKATRAAAYGRSQGRKTAMLVLPELSIPRQWFRHVALHVVRTGRFGMVAGLEYLHDFSRPYVLNQAVAVLPGPFASVASWPWTKRYPAREERIHLADVGLEFSPLTNLPKAIPRVAVVCPWGRFSVLICSELIEARRVADLLGRVELVLCPAWNTDTASYDHLIQSVGLHLHAIVAVANNAQYSDCRAWGPYAERWRRDLCRLIERNTNDVVHVDLPMASLRSFRLAAMSGATTIDSEGESKKKGPVWRPLPPDWP